MDIHKPKPWHGVREFGKELSTIVLGVLIALAGEQAVEWIHHQSEVGEAREALREEIGQDMMKALYNQGREICQQPQIRQYIAWSEGAGSPPPAANSRFLVLSSANWDTVKAGPVAFMPLKQRLAFAHFYDQVADYNSMAERERSAGFRVAENLGFKPLDREDGKVAKRAATSLSQTELILIGMANGIRIPGEEAGARVAPLPSRYAAEQGAFCGAARPSAAQGR